MGIFKGEAEKLRLELWRVNAETTDFSGKKLRYASGNLKTFGAQIANKDGSDLYFEKSAIQ